jgi:uncharacterized protein DUF2154
MRCLGLQLPPLTDAYGDLSRKERMVATTPTKTVTEQGKKGRSRPVALGKIDLLMAFLGLLVLAGAYRLTFLPEALTLLLLDFGTNEGDGMKRLAVLVVAAAVLLTSCGAQGRGQGVGEMQNESRSVQPEDATSVCAHLMMGAGELKVGGAADALVEGDFSYNVADWKPRIGYDFSGEKGELTVEQGSGDDGRLSGGARNE